MTPTPRTLIVTVLTTLAVGVMAGVVAPITLALAVLGLGAIVAAGLVVVTLDDSPDVATDGGRDTGAPPPATLREQLKPGAILAAILTPPMIAALPPDRWWFVGLAVLAVGVVVLAWAVRVVKASG